ncbi:glycosyltransferase family 9 protein [bacterium]|nr:glycosyltransferase family 9 protein [bacterium]
MNVNIAIRYSSLGDLVLCTALVAKLKAENPTEPLIFVSKPQFKELITKRFPHDRLLFFDGSSGLVGPFLEGLKLAMLCHREFQATEIKFFDLHGTLKSASFFLGVKLYSLFKKVKVSLLRTHKHSFSRSLSVMFHKDFNGERHVFLDHLKTSGSSMNYFPVLKAFDRTPRTTERILLAPDAQHWKKRWIVSHWEKLFELLLAHPRNFEITLVGEQHCLPIDVTDDLQSLGKDRVENLLGKTDLQTLPDIAANHDITVCSNSAWLHISEAVGIPVVSLSGPITKGFGFSPWRPQSRELYVDLSCRPCTKHGDGRCLKSGSDFHACMKRIEAEEVYDEVLKVLRISK